MIDSLRGWLERSAWPFWLGLLIAILLVGLLPHPALVAYGGPSQGVYAFIQHHWPDLYAVLTSMEAGTFYRALALPGSVICLQMLSSYWFPDNGPAFRRWMIWPAAGLIAMLGLQLIATFLRLTFFEPFETALFLERTAGLLSVAVVVSPTLAKIFNPARTGRIPTALWWEIAAAALVVATFVVDLLPILFSLFSPQVFRGVAFLDSGTAVGVGYVLGFALIAMLYHWLDRMVRRPFNRVLAAAHWAFFVASRLMILLFAAITHVRNGARADFGPLAIFRSDPYLSHLDYAGNADQVYARMAVLDLIATAIFLILVAELIIRRFRQGPDPQYDEGEAKTARRWAAAIFTGVLVLNVPAILVVMRF